MPKILIADDNTNIQRMVSLAFEERGIKVVAVGNGEAAVRRLADLDPDLVLADIFMPVRSGYEVCEYIKKDKNFCHIPVILLVGAFDPLDEKEARRVGADGILKKPFVPPDPLIAMVTSALEKNPRVAAELARSKQIIAEPPSLQQPEIAKIEPKPLPQFPEPSPEEAALIYGFGSGRRSTLDDQKEPESPTPIEAGTEEELEATDTSHDWQRAAMNFEVPQEEGGRPAFSDETAFASGLVLPLLHIPVPESDVEPEPDSAANVDCTPDTPAPLSVPEATVPEAVDTPVPAPPSFAASEETPATVAPEREMIADESKIQSDTGISSNVPHWMDALSTEPSDGGWMSALSQQREEPNKAEEIHGPLGSLDFSTPITVIPESPAEEQKVTAASVSQSTDKGSFNDAGPVGESWFAPLPKALDLSREPVPQPADSQHAGHYPLDLKMKLIAAPADTEASRREPELDDPSAMRANPEPLLDVEEADVPSSVSRRDPNLVVPPAVHVTPEPLLDTEEEAQSTMHMYSHMAGIPPAYSMHVPPSPQPGAEEAPEPRSEILTQPPVETYDEPPMEPAFSSVESSVEEFSERIPTGPPPSAQALEGIPFLTPPQDIHRPATEETEVSSETVDAVVRKVLERLEPQLHDLLSQSLLKPLVENMLNGELSKKNR